MKIEIKNGHVIDPRHGVDRNATLYIAAGKVAALGEAPAAAKEESTQAIGAGR